MRSRILRILPLFHRRYVWTVEAIAREMGVSVSSAYRDVQELSRGGFLDPFPGAGYVLGPAFVEYDRLLRTTDPLIRSSVPVMQRLLRDTTPEGIAVLSRRYRDRVICVHQEKGSESRTSTVTDRGVAMPLFMGATAKAILAHVDDRALKRTYLENQAQIRKAPGCEDIKSFRAQMRGIRKAGYAITIGELGPDRIGIAAPILIGGAVVAALSLAGLRGTALSKKVQERYAEQVVRAAKRISLAISRDNT